jgi:hypothetical protein
MPDEPKTEYVRIRYHVERRPDGTYLIPQPETPTMPEDETQKKKEWADERFARLKAHYEKEATLTERPVALPQWLWNALDRRSSSLGVSPDILLRLWLSERLEERP